MPRVAIKKKDYMKSDFSASIVGKLYQKNMTRTQLGQALNISQPAASQKLKNNQYTMDDLMIIFKVLEYSDEEIVKYLRI